MGKKTKKQAAIAIEEIRTAEAGAAPRQFVGYGIRQIAAAVPAGNRCGHTLLRWVRTRSLAMMSIDIKMVSE